MKKKALSLALALVMCLGLTVPVFAENADDLSGNQYIKLSKPPVGQVRFTTLEGNQVTTLLLADDTMILLSVPEDIREAYQESEGGYAYYSLLIALGGPAGLPEGSSVPAGESGYVVNDYNIEGESLSYVTESTADYYESEGLTVERTYFTKPTDPEPTTPPAAESAVASPTNDSLTADGVLQTPTVYKINGSNYFKIRDLAAILNGTEKQFSVGYDSELKSVTATTGEGYEKQEGDLAGAPAGGEKTAEPSNDAIYINGEKVEAEVYKIDGSNYFKLRDLGKALDFYVGYSQETGVFLETDKPYAE